MTYPMGGIIIFHGRHGIIILLDAFFPPYKDP